MTASAENKELLRRIFEALSRGDSRPFVEALAPDVDCFVYQLENGAIKEVTEYLDTELVTAALAPA